MSDDTHILPETRSWREIPQQVRPRAMSGEGRRRMAMGVMRVAIGAAVIAGVAWGVWAVAAVLRDNPDSMPEAAKSDRVKSLVRQVRVRLTGTSSDTAASQPLRVTSARTRHCKDSVAESAVRSPDSD